MNKKASFIKSGVLAILGLLFIIFPEIVAKYIMIIIGIVIVLYGAINLLTSIKIENKITLKIGLITFITGILIILLSDFILSMVGILVAIYCLFSGVSGVGIALKRKEMNLPFLFQLGKGAITLIISVVFFVLPKSFIHIQIIILGGYLLISAISQLYKGLTASEQEYDFVNFYFHNNHYENNNDYIKKDDSIIDIESSVVDSEEN